MSLFDRIMEASDPDTYPAHDPYVVGSHPRDYASYLEKTGGLSKKEKSWLKAFKKDNGSSYRQAVEPGKKKKSLSAFKRMRTTRKLKKSGTAASSKQAREDARTHDYVSKGFIKAPTSSDKSAMSRHTDRVKRLAKTGSSGEAGQGCPPGFHMTFGQCRKISKKHAALRAANKQ